MDSRQLGRIGAIALLLWLPACGGSSRGDFDSPGSAGAGAGNAAGQGGSGTGGTDAAGKGGSASGAGGASAGGGGDAGAGPSGGNGGGGKGGSGDPAGRGGAEAGQGGSASGAGGTSGRAGEGGASNAGAGGAATIEDLEETVDAFCTAAASCCSAMGQPVMLENCSEMYAMNQPAVPAIMSGAITLDAAALARCRAAYAEGPDQCNLNAIVAACQGVFVGNQQVDEPCIGGYDCDRSEDTMTCLITDTSSAEPVGVCKRVPHAGPDEVCTFTCGIGADCSSSTYGSTDALPLCFEGEGLFCEYVGPDSLCRPIVAMGEACTSFDSCGSRGYCEGTCKPLSDLGEPCGAGCIRKFQCGPEGRCVDPTWATESACMGYAPAP